MRKLKLLIGFLWLISFASFGVSAQNKSPYPQTAEDVIEFVETLIKSNFSEKETVKRLGTIEKNDDDENYDEYFFALKPYPSGEKIIESIEISISDEDKKVAQVDLRYLNPIKINYGTMRKKYGAAKLLPSPIVNCGDVVNCKRKLFVGYNFERTGTNGGKKFKMMIFLQMKSTSVFPKHTDKSLLEVESLSFRLIPEDLL